METSASPVRPRLSLTDALDKALKQPKMVLILKVILFAACLWPLLEPPLHLYRDPLALGANPAEHIIRDYGDWALQLLLLTLLITPLRLWLGVGGLLRFRRMLGLFAFAALCLHVLAYLGFDRFFIWDEIWADLIKRPFITLGMIGFLLLLVLALTSSRAMVLRLGGAVWKRIHKLIYPASILAVIHYWLMVKRDVTEPLIYACLLFMLLAARLPQIRPWLKKRRT